MLYNPPSGSTDPNAPYVPKNVAAGTQGSKVPPAAVEYTQREIINAIIAAGLTPTNGDLTQLAQAINALVGRQTVTNAPIDYYVNANTGSDNNSGLSSGTALATIQKAIDLGSRVRTLGGVAINVRVADGTYAPFMIGVRDTTFNLIGNQATPSNCLITNPTPGNPCALFAGSRATMQGFRLGGTGPGVKAIEGSIVKIGALESNIAGAQANEGYFVRALDASIVRAIGTLRQLATNLGSVFVAGSGCTIDLNAQTIILDALTAVVSTGVPGMVAWANGGFIKADGVTFSGAGPANAKRYQADAGGGSVFTNGAGANFIPGTLAGTGSYS